MTPIAIGFPPAVMGYAAMNPGVGVRICSWHPSGVKEAEAWAGSLPKTHGICESCAQRLHRELLGEPKP